MSEPEAVMKRADDVLYHMDPKKPEDEELGFNTVAGYNTFLQHNGLWKENAPRIIVTGPMGEPSGLIAKLEETGNMVYPIRSMRSLFRTMELILSVRLLLSIWRMDVWVNLL